MKKIFVLLAVAMGIFAFSTGAFAAASSDIVECLSCDKCYLGVLPCPGTVVQGGNEPTCGYFDYDANNGLGYGYASGRSANGKCAAIFPICDCDNTETIFVEDHTIGVRMTIMVNGAYGEKGAYWSAPGDPNIEFGKFASKNLACASNIYGSNFGPGTWWKVDNAGASTDEVFSLAVNPTCTVAAGNRATRLVTDVTSGYTITADDESNKLSYWKIDIPPIRIDPSKLNNCELISVLVELLDQSTGGICADCVAVCECLINVAQVCCQATTTTTDSCLYPYFSSTTEATEEQPFWNGIVVTNTSDVDGTATLTVYQKDEKVGTYTTDAIKAHSMFVQALENIGFSGDVLGGNQPVYIYVTTTFPSMDGFAIIANTATGESMGYLCRKPECK